MQEDLINPLVLKERAANDKLIESRQAAVAAREAGFAIPIRRVGVLDCESRSRKLPSSVPVEGDLGLSVLQDLVMSDWHPVNIVDGTEVINPNDFWVGQIEAAYPGAGVAEFVVACWQELQEFNASGGYCVEIPWNAAAGRELTPSEVMQLMISGRQEQ